MTMEVFCLFLGVSVLVFMRTIFEIQSSKNQSAKDCSLGRMEHAGHTSHGLFRAKNKDLEKFLGECNLEEKTRKHRMFNLNFVISSPKNSFSQANGDQFWDYRFWNTTFLIYLTGLASNAGDSSQTPFTF